jgi:four helix bundle protein
VRVQVPLRVLKKSESVSESEHFHSFSLNSLSHLLFSFLRELDFSHIFLKVALSLAYSLRLVLTYFIIMFDFQKLEVYQKTKNFCIEITATLSEKSFDRVTNDQLRRASFSIMLNIAEGSSRFSNRDRKNFLVIARGSACECYAIMEYLLETKMLSKEVFDDYTIKLEEISRMLFGLIRNL